MIIILDFLGYPKLCERTPNYYIFNPCADISYGTEENETTVKQQEK